MFEKITNNKRKFILLSTIALFIYSLFAIYYNIQFLFVLPIIALIVVFSLKIEFGIYLMAFSLPMIGWNFYFFNLEIPFIDLLSLFVFTSFISSLLFKMVFGNKNVSKKIKWPWIFSFTLFFASFMLSSFFSKDQFFSLWYTIRWIFVLYTFYIFLPVQIINKKEVLKNILIAFLLSGLLMSFLAILSLFIQDWSFFVRMKPISIFGIYLFGDNQNLIAESLLPSLFFSLALREKINNILFKKVINISAILMLVVAVGTFSRAAWLSLFLASLIFLIFGIKKNVQNKKRIVVGLSVVIILMIPVFVYMYQMQTAYRIGVSSTENRLLLTEISWQAFKENPVLGKGPGQYINLVADNVRFRAKYGDPIDSHGVLQKILAENGLLGVIAFIFFSVVVLFSLLPALKRNKEKKYFLFLFLAFFSIYFFQIFNTSYFKAKTWFPAAVVLSAITIYKEDNEE